jgi:hypothetical protein
VLNFLRLLAIACVSAFCQSSISASISKFTLPAPIPIYQGSGSYISDKIDPPTGHKLYVHATGAVQTIFYGETTPETQGRYLIVQQVLWGTPFSDLTILLFEDYFFTQIDHSGTVVRRTFSTDMILDVDWAPMYSTYEDPIYNYFGPGGHTGKEGLYWLDSNVQLTELSLSLSYSPIPSPIPEPSTWQIVALGFALVALRYRVKAS